MKAKPKYNSAVYFRCKYTKMHCSVFKNAFRKETIKNYTEKMHIMA